MSKLSMIEIDHHETPLTWVTDQTLGDARIRHTLYEKGVYSMEGVLDKDYYRIERPMRVTQLQRRVRGAAWKTWMVDDPLHWYGMGELVRRLPPGQLLVAGLGLGLFAHHLMRRPDITGVMIVEIDRSVIDLVAPTLPKDRKFHMTHDDFYSVLSDTLTAGPDAYDAILWDLAVGDHDQTRHEFGYASAMCQVYAPNVPLFRFGDKNIYKEVSVG